MTMNKAREIYEKMLWVAENPLTAASKLLVLEEENKILRDELEYYFSRFSEDSLWEESRKN